MLISLLQSNTLENKNDAWPSTVAHIYNPSYEGGGVRRIAVQGYPGQNVRLYSGVIKAKRAEGMAQEVEH
jgi:hypothetical protein